MTMLFKRFFLFTFIRSFMRLLWRGQALREQRREIEWLARELDRSRNEARILAYAYEDGFRPIREGLEAEHTAAITSLMRQIQMGTRIRELLAGEVITKNNEIKSLQRDIASLHQAALTDPLTGLYNRRGADEALSRLLSVFDRENHRSVATTSSTKVHDLSVLVFDLNNFKEVNDRFGHVAGDTVLVVLAEHLRHAFRAEDVLVRAGGDEFKAYLINATREGATTRAGKLGSLLNTDERLRYGDLCVTVSIGIAHGCFVTRRGGLQIIETLDRLADTAMYAAKAESRDASVIVVAPDAISSDTVFGQL